MVVERIKGIIFDYGATLDTDGCHWGIMFLRAYRRLGVSLPETTLRDAYVYAERTMAKRPFITADDTFRTTLSIKISLQLDYLRQQGCHLAFGKSAHVLLEDLYTQVATNMETTKTVLHDLSEIYPMVLVSNFYGNIHTVLREFGILRFFLHVIESAVVGVRKPDPAIFLLGAEALEMLPSQVAVVGDSLEKDIKPAHNGGFNTVWLKGEGWTPVPEQAPEADVIISRLSEILRVLQHRNSLVIK